MAIQDESIGSASELQDAITKKHTQGADTALGQQAEDLDMNTHKITGVTGIGFPGTQTPSADANTLDDYEEGTYTPTVVQGITTPSYSTQNGWYTKIGNTVFFSAQIVLNGGTPTGSALHISLPFVVNASHPVHIFQVQMAIATGGATGVFARGGSGSATSFIVTQGATGVANYLGTSLGNSGNMSIQGVYQI